MEPKDMPRDFTPEEQEYLNGLPESSREHILKKSNEDPGLIPRLMDRGKRLDILSDPSLQHGGTREGAQRIMDEQQNTAVLEDAKVTGGYVDTDRGVQMASASLVIPSITPRESSGTTAKLDTPEDIGYFEDMVTRGVPRMITGLGVRMYKGVSEYVVAPVHSALWHTTRYLNEQGFDSIEAIPEEQYKQVIDHLTWSLEDTEKAISVYGTFPPAATIPGVIAAEAGPQVITYIALSKAMAAYGITSATASVLGRLGIATQNAGRITQAGIAFTDFVMTSGLSAAIAGGDDTLTRSLIDTWTGDPQKFIEWHDSLPIWQRALFKIGDDLIGGLMGQGLIVGAKVAKGVASEFMQTYGKTLGNNPAAIPYVKEILEGWGSGLKKALSAESKEAISESLSKIKPVTPVAETVVPVTKEILEDTPVPKDIPSVTIPKVPAIDISPSLSTKADGEVIFQTAYPDGTTIVNKRGRKPAPTVGPLQAPVFEVAEAPQPTVVDFVEDILEKSDEAAINSVSVESTDTAVKVTRAVRKQSTAVTKEAPGPVQLPPKVTPKTPVSEVQPIDLSTSIISNRTIKRVNQHWSPVEVRLGQDSWIRVENAMDADVIEVMAKLEMYPEISGLKKDAQKKLYAELDDVMKTYGMTLDDVGAIYEKYKPALDQLVETTEQEVDGVIVQKKRWKFTQEFTADKKKYATIDAATGAPFIPNVKLRSDLLKAEKLKGVPVQILDPDKPMTEAEVLNVIRRVMSGDYSGLSDEMIEGTAKETAETVAPKATVVEVLEEAATTTPAKKPKSTPKKKTPAAQVAEVKEAVVEAAAPAKASTRKAPVSQASRIAQLRQNAEDIAAQLKDMKKSKAPKEDIAQTSAVLKKVQNTLMELEGKSTEPAAIPMTAKERIAAMKEAAAKRAAEVPEGPVPQDILDAQEMLDVSREALADMAEDGVRAPKSLLDEVKALEDKVAPYSNKIQKLSRGRSGSAMTMIDAGVAAFQMILDKYDKVTPKLVKEAVSFLGMPMVATTAASIADRFIGEDDFSTTTYLGLFAAITAVRAGVGLKQTMGLRALTREATPELSRILHDQNVTMVSALKTIQKHLPEERAREIFDGVADDILSQTYSIGKQILDKMAKEAEDAVGKLPGMFDSALVIPQNFLEGNTRGSAKLLNPALLDHPALQIEAIRDLITGYKGAIVKRGTIEAGAEVAIHNRLKKAQAHYGITPENMSKVAEVFGLDLQNVNDVYSFLLAADSVESMFLGKVKDLSKKLTPKNIASTLETFGQFRIFHELLNNPENLFKNQTLEQAQELIMSSRAVGALLEDGQTNSKLAQRWLKSGYQAMARVKRFVAMGDEGRPKLFNFMRKLPGDPSTWDTVVIGMYNALLSGPIMLTTSALANIGVQGLLVTNEALKFATGKLTKDVRLTGGSQAYLGHYSLDNIGTAIQNFYLSAKAGVSVFDPLSARDSTRRSMDNLARNLNDPKETSTFIMKALRNLGDAVGVTGSSIIAGFDAFSQTLSHGARLKQLMYQEAYDNLVATGHKNVTPDQVANYIVNKMSAAPDYVANLSNQAKLHSRMSSFQGPVTKPMWDGSIEEGLVSTEAPGLMTRGVEHVVELHNKSTIGNLLAPFMGTAARSHGVGVTYSPFGIFEDLITPSSTIRQYMRSGFTGMSAAQQAIAKEELISMGTRTTTGLMWALGIYGILNALDAKVVMPGKDSDTVIKSETGANSGDISYRSPNGDIHVYRTRMHTWVLPALNMVNQVGQWFSGEPLDEEAMANQRGWLTCLGTLFDSATSDTKTQFLKMYTKVHEVLDAGDGEALLKMVMNQWLSTASRFDPTFVRELMKRADGFLSASRSRGGLQKLDLVGLPTEVDDIGATEMTIGPKEITKANALRTAFARAGVDTKPAPRFSWQGEPIEDRELSHKIQSTLGKYLRNNSDALIEELNRHPPEERKGVAQQIISSFKSRALAEHYDDIQKWELDKQKSITGTTRDTIERLLGGLE